MLARLSIFAVLASVTLVGALPASAAQQTRPRELQVAACNAVKINGTGYVLYRRGVSCSFAKTWAKRLAGSKGRRKPPGYSCSSGSKFRGGGYCERGNRHFGWHSGE